MTHAIPIETPKNLGEFMRRAAAVLQKESDIDEFVDNPLDHVVELRALLTSYATGEDAGAVEPRVLLEYFEQYIKEAGETKIPLPDKR